MPASRSRRALTLSACRLIPWLAATALAVGWLAPAQAQEQSGRVTLAGKPLDNIDVFGLPSDQALTAEPRAVTDPSGAFALPLSRVVVAVRALDQVRDADGMAHVLRSGAEPVRSGRLELALVEQLEPGGWKRLSPAALQALAAAVAVPTQPELAEFALLWAQLERGVKPDAAATEVLRRREGALLRAKLGALVRQARAQGDVALQGQWADRAEQLGRELGIAELEFQGAMTRSWLPVNPGQPLAGQQAAERARAVASLQRAVAKRPGDVQRATLHLGQALGAKGVNLFKMGQTAQARAELGRAAQFLEQAGDQRELATALFYHGIIALRAGDSAAAGAALQRSLELFQRCEDPGLAARTERTLANLAVGEARLGLLDRAALGFARAGQRRDAAEALGILAEDHAKAGRWVQAGAVEERRGDLLAHEPEARVQAWEALLAAATHLKDAGAAHAPAMTAHFERAFTFAQQHRLGPQVGETAFEALFAVCTLVPKDLPLLERAVALGRVALAAGDAQPELPGYPELVQAQLLGLSTIGLAAREAGQLAQAERATREQAALAQRRGLRRDLETAYQALSLLFTLHGDHAANAENARKRLALLEDPALRAEIDAWAAAHSATPEQRKQLGSVQQMASVLSTLASSLEALGQLGEAMAAQKRCVAALETAGWRDEAFVERALLARLQLQALDPGLDATLRRLATDAADDDRRSMALSLQLQADLTRAPTFAALSALAGPTDRLRQWLQSRPKPAGSVSDSKGLGVISAWAMVGLAYEQFGRLEDALAAQRVVATTAPPQLRGLIRWHEARLCKTLGRLQEALDAERAVMRGKEWWPFLQPSIQLAVLVDALQLARHLGDQALAAEAEREGAQLAEKLSAFATLSQIDCMALGHWRLLQGQTELRAGREVAAVTALNIARALLKTSGTRELKAETDVWLAVAKLRRRGPSEAADPATDLTDLQDELADALGEAAAVVATQALLVGIPALADGAGRPALGKRAELLAVARRRAEELGRLSDLPQLYFAEAESLVAMGDPHQAQQRYLQALSHLESLRGTLLSDELKVRYLEAGDEAMFARTIEFLVGQGQAEQALTVSERARGRALTDLLASGELRRQLADQPKAKKLRDILARLRALAPRPGDVPLDDALARSAAAQGQAGRAGTLPLPKLARADLSEREQVAQARALLAEVERVRREAAGDDSELLSLAVAPPVDASEVQALARRNHATLIEYYVSECSLVVFTVAPKGPIRARVVQVTRQELDQQIAALRQALGVSRARGAEAVGGPSSAVEVGAQLAKLHAQLLAPVLPEVAPGSAIAFVPHQSLFLVPFAALAASDAGPPLIQLHPLTVVPAAAVLRYTAQKRARALREPSALVVGNPAMPLVAGQPLDPLPGAEAEARAVAKLVGGRVQLLTGPAATERAVRAALPTARWIHLATHGFARDDQPMRSFVALTPSGPGPGEDGLLSVGEVFGLGLRADLVTLSACQSGLGRLSGDGVMGLGRAFLYAGTPSVLVSLWSVSDEATDWQMQAFYRALAAGQSKARALQTAQLAARQRFGDLAKWGAFVLLGSGE